MAFYPGQKVVCIDDSPDQWTGAHPNVFKGHIYTVKSASAGVSKTGLTLHEADPPPPYVGWMRDRFRPAVSRKTDISIFTKMLTPEKENA